MFFQKVEYKKANNLLNNLVVQEYFYFILEKYIKKMIFNGLSQLININNYIVSYF